jgi:hypothetical protein
MASNPRGRVARCVLRDSVPDRPHWPGWRVLHDLVVGGWRIRWRMHPPLRAWLGYRLFDRRLPPAWHEWARDDINGWWWRLRNNALLSLVLLLVWGESVLVPGGFMGVEAPLLLVAQVPLSLVFYRRRRRLALRKHVPDWPPMMWVPMTVWVSPPTRSRATPFLAPMGLLLMIGAPCAAWSLLYPNSGPISRALSFGSDDEDLGHIFGLTLGVVGLGVAVLLTALIALRHRIPDRLATRQPGSQPATRPSPRTLVAVLAAQLVLEFALCVGQLAGDIPGIFCLVLAGAGCVGLAMVALAVVARRSERRLGLDVTWRDCERAILGMGSVIPPELGQWVTMPRLTPIEGPLASV